MADNPLTARYVEGASHMVEPYPAQMVCLGDPAHDGREWWWFQVDDADRLHVRCQDAAKVDC